jgi:hypothetical protein
MSLNSLLESANQQNTAQSDAAKLAAKWEKTGLLEGLDGMHKDNMGVILENQAKQLVVESSQTQAGGAGFTAGNGESWAGVALPLVRKVFGQIAAKEFVSVQPMNLPSGLVFYLDFQYGTDKAPFAAGESLYGDRGGNEPFGNTNEGGFYGAGRFGYSINNTASADVTDTLTTASWSDMNFDSDYSASAAAGDYRLVTIADSELPNLDVEGVRGFALQVSSSVVNLPVFTKHNSTANTTSFVALASDVEGETLDVVYQMAPVDNNRGDFEDGNTGLNGSNSPAISIPEINVQMKSSAIVAKTRKLKAVWTPEFAQDLNAYHSLDAEAELTSILSEHISLEIDLEILDMLMDSAAAGTEYWSAVSNQFINNAADGFDGRGVADGGYYNTQGQWFQTLGTKIQKLSNNIHQKTLRGGANFMVISPKVATILESIPGFAADTNGDVDKMNYAFGVQKMGALNGGKLKVYKNPYMIENQILMGFRGGQFLEAGAVFSPYIPLIMTPLVYDPDTFTPRKGLLTRYAKKIVRPEFYGKIQVAGLNTI